MVSFELLQGVDEVLDAVFWDIKICALGGQPKFFIIKDRYGSILISGKDEVPFVIDMMNTNLVGDEVGRITCGSHLGYLQSW
jgi:hypothetical protein